MGEQASYEQLERKASVSTAVELRHRITHLLKSRRAPKGSQAAKMEDRIKTRGLRAWNAVEKRPVTGSLLVSGVGLAAAMAVGGAELTIAMLLGYSAYQVLRERTPPREAAQHLFGTLEHPT
jgi:hypothetical protein